MITELQLELGPNSIISHILDDKIQNNTRIHLIMSNYISDVGHAQTLGLDLENPYTFKASVEKVLSHAVGTWKTKCSKKPLLSSPVKPRSLNAGTCCEH